MTPSKRWTVHLNEHGELVLPAEAAARFGLKPGTRAHVVLEGEELRILRPVSSLARVNVEPTNTCNFDCRTCMRNVWNETPGFMSAETFRNVLEGIHSLSPRPMVFFGGYGEPLAHPQIIEMVNLAHQAGSAVELITNGSLLDPNTAQGLKDAGLDRLWVSLDGATPDSYADIRLGEALPVVLKNLKDLWRLRNYQTWERPRLGIAFVAMKRNLSELPEVLHLGRRIGADRFSISNVLAHTQELNEQILYHRSMDVLDVQPSEWEPLLDLPRMDKTPEVWAALSSTLQNIDQLSIARQPLQFGARTCPFIQKGSTSVRWDGEVSPCLPLLHTHSSFLDDRPRQSAAHSFGNINERSLIEIWESRSYTELRERVQAFDFSPCVVCNACDMADHNREDCFGNIAPTCGGCLWAQGFIQCP